jgi:hypothetical protein
LSRRSYSGAESKAEGKGARHVKICEAEQKEFIDNPSRNEAEENNKNNKEEHYGVCVDIRNVPRIPNRQNLRP